MDPKLINNIRSILNITNIKNQLEEFMASRDISPDSLVYPPTLRGIQEISDKIEVIPSMKELNPTDGNFQVTWNIFVYGTNRRPLGSTCHESISELELTEPSEYALKNSVCETTWKDIIKFIVETMQKYDDDPTMTPAGQPSVQASKMPSSNYYEANKSVGRQV